MGDDLQINGNWVNPTWILMKERSLRSFQRGPTESCRRTRSAACLIAGAVSSLGLGQVRELVALRAQVLELDAEALTER